MAVADDLERKLLLFAVLSRCTLIVLQIIFNNLFPDHDADVFNPPTKVDSSQPSGALDYIVETTLSGLNRWDAVYFIHIAEYGYIYQNSLAFFPLFPFLVKLIANTLCYILQFVLTYRNVILVSAVICNMSFFVLSVILLFRLGRNVIGNCYTAYKACLLFCINPASIFMVGSYSETLYFFCVVYGLYYLESSRKMQAVFMFALSSLARSNGLLNIGFILYDNFIFLGITLRSFVYGMSSTKNDSKNISMAFRIFTFCNIVLAQFTYLFISIVLFLVPFIMYQIYYVNEIFCKIDTKSLSAIPNHLVTYGLNRDYHIIGDSMPPWCNFTIPLSYSYIQSSHWGVGFMKYYELKQIPNFFLAVPVTVLSVGCVWCYVKWNQRTCLTLGMECDITAIKKNDGERRCLWNNPRLLPYVVHILMLTLFGWMFIHIQVLTRMLFSSSPILYWFAAYCTSDETKTQVTIRNEYDVIRPREDIYKVEKEENLEHSLKNILTDQIINFSKQSFVSKLILCHFLFYFTVGTFMFCNFLPWT